MPQDGFTALMLAARRGGTEAVSVLVGAGAALDVVSKTVLAACCVQWMQGGGRRMPWGALGGGG